MKLLFLVCVAASIFAENTANATDLEQRRFSAEDETLTRPASIPSEVIALLAQDSDVKDALTDEPLDLMRSRAHGSLRPKSICATRGKRIS
jgi:hypothetical protein